MAVELSCLQGRDANSDDQTFADEASVPGHAPWRVDQAGRRRRAAGMAV